MTCQLCKHGNTRDGFTTLVFEKDEKTIVIKVVPAEVCDNCSEAYLSEEVSEKLLEIVDTESKKGIEIEVLNYAA